MRRIRQQLPEEESIQILKNATSGTLALLGDGGYPYSLPISFVYADGRLFFHSALNGHKIDAIHGCDKASFSVIQKDDVKPEKYTTCFRSVICFGHIRILDNDEDKMKAIRMLGNRYNPGNDDALEAEIRKSFNAMCVIELDIEHMTGKESVELTKMRK